MTKNYLSVIVPCFNEEENILRLYNRLIPIINKLELKYNIIFIDDGSTDSTWKKINEVKSKDENIVGLKFSRNFGHPSSIKAGIDYCNVNSDYVLILDCDLQDPPELIEEMMIKIKNKNLNTVFAQRKSTNENFFKRKTSKLFYVFFNKISDTKIPENTSDFRIFDKKILNTLKKLNNNDLFYRGLIPWLGFKSESVLFDRENRTHGETGWTKSKMINFAINGFLNFSSYPMRLAFVLSFIFSIIFIFLLFYVIFAYLNGSTMKGWASIVLVITFSNAIILFILGLLSEYIGRVHSEIKKRPSYIIDEKI